MNMSNGLTFAILHITLRICYRYYDMSHDLSLVLEMSCTKFHENRLIIDGEIDQKHALDSSLPGPRA